MGLEIREIKLLFFLVSNLNLVFSINESRQQITVVLSVPEILSSIKITDYFIWLYDYYRDLKYNLPLPPA